MTRHDVSSLRSLPVFASLSRRALSVVDSLLTPVTFADGDVLCVEGELGRQAFVIVSGTAAVSRGEQMLATVGPGDVVGELALLSGGRRTASVTAAEPIRALVMSAQEFNSLLGMPAVADEIRRIADSRTVIPAQPVAAA